MTQQYDSIEYYDDKTIAEWVKLYQDNPGKMYLTEVGFTVFEVFRESIRRGQNNGIYKD